MTYSTYDIVEEEVVQLTENKEDGRNHIIPHRPDFVENAEHNVQHDAEIDKSSAKMPTCQTARHLGSTRVKYIRSRPYTGKHENWYAAEGLRWV
jgi:hypothetical protein